MKKQSKMVLRMQGDAGWATAGGAGRPFGDRLRKSQAWESSVDDDGLSSASTPPKSNTPTNGDGKMRSRGELRFPATGEEFTIARGNAEAGGRMLVPAQRQPIPVLEGERTHPPHHTRPLSSTRITI